MEAPILSDDISNLLKFVQPSSPRIPDKYNTCLEHVSVSISSDSV